MVRIVIVLFLFLSLSVEGQDVLKVSLRNSQIQTEGISFKIAEIIDARKDKKVIGIIQRGINNRKDLAVFEKPGLLELQNLLERSQLISQQGFALRVTKLQISELMHSWKETGKAEVSLDFFIKSDDGLYYHVASVYASHEDKSVLDVTENHNVFIAASIEKAFKQFSKLNHKVDDSIEFTYEELQDSKLTFRDVSAMPIMQTTTYADGFYTTFDEFINNSPSIDSNCKIRMGGKIKLKCNDKGENSVSIYGFAKDNQLYILYHEEFFPLSKERDTFYFKGPRTISGAGMAAIGGAWVTTGMIGAASAQSAYQYNSIYAIDLMNGSIRNISDL